MALKIRPLVGRTHLGPVNRVQDDRCERLKRALPYTQASSVSFVRSLIDGYERFGSWTDKQSHYVDQMLEAARNAYRASKHAATRVEVLVSEDGLIGLNRLFDMAKGALKRPALLLKVEDTQVKLVPGRTAGEIAVFDKGIQGPGGFLGTLKADGQVSLRPSCPLPAQALADAASRLGEDPAKAAREFGEATKACMCCGAELTHPVSRKYGIGPICNSNWGVYPPGEYVRPKGARIAG